MEDTHRQLEDLKLGQEKILDRLDAMNGDFRDMTIELGGVPGIGRDPTRRSLRRRLHDLENDRTTARIAATTLDAAKEIRAAAGNTRFTRREKNLGLVLAAIVAVGPYITLFLHH